MPDPIDPKEAVWAQPIIQKHIEFGLKKLSDPAFLTKRYREFERKADPLYGKLIAGMDDAPLSRAFISYWTIAQTLATQSRFWLEDAIADIVIARAIRDGRQRRVFTQHMLGNGWLDRGVDVTTMGESWREDLSARRPWRQRIHKDALDVIDQIVGVQERERVDRRRRPGRSWANPNDHDAAAVDQLALTRIAGSMSGPKVEVTLQCNLLVMEPDRNDEQPHIWGLRFVNPKTIASHPARKQERANLLRLFAFLVQEKILRSPSQIELRVAELLPRHGEFDDLDRYPDYFSSQTYWNHERLWQFIGVPYECVPLAMQNAAKTLQQLLRSGLRNLLPRDPLK